MKQLSRVGLGPPKGKYDPESPQEKDRWGKPCPNQTHFQAETRVVSREF